MKNTDTLITNLNQIFPLQEGLIDYLNHTLRQDYIERKKVILKEGQIAKRIYFIEKGFCRAFYVAADKEYTSWFMGDGDVMISVYSFFTQRPSYEGIEALEDSVLLSITWDQLQEIYAEYPSFNVIGRILTEQYYIKSEERAIDLRTRSAGERYEKLITEHPHILKKATLGQIATYLGVSLETISRIRAKR